MIEIRISGAQTLASLTSMASSFLTSLVITMMWSIWSKVLLVNHGKTLPHSWFIRLRGSCVRPKVAVFLQTLSKFALRKTGIDG